MVSSRNLTEEETNSCGYTSSPSCLIPHPGVPPENTHGEEFWLSPANLFAKKGWKPFQTDVFLHTTKLSLLLVSDA